MATRSSSRLICCAYKAIPMSMSLLHCLLLFSLLLVTLTRQQDLNCVGCRKPAPPQCCPATCPRCLPVAKRAEVLGQRRSNSLPVHVRRLQDDNKSVRGEKRQARQVPLLDENDFYQLDAWAIPNKQCAGPDCVCANCVCCYTETLLYSTTVTCTDTIQSTVFSTSTFFEFFGLNTFISLTNYINFTVTNPVQFISTIAQTRTARTTLTATLTIPETVTSFDQVFINTVTELGAVGTTFSFLSGGPTVFSITTTTVTLFGPSSSASLSTITRTEAIPTTTFTSISSIEIFKCFRPVTLNVTDTLDVTGTLPIYQTVIPTITFIDGTTTVDQTETATETLEKTRGCTTVRFTPIRTIEHLETAKHNSDEPPGCPCLSP